MLFPCCEGGHLAEGVCHLLVDQEQPHPEVGEGGEGPGLHLHRVPGGGHVDSEGWCAVLPHTQHHAGGGQVGGQAGGVAVVHIVGGVVTGTAATPQQGLAWTQGWIPGSLHQAKQIIV